MKEMILQAYMNEIALEISQKAYLIVDREMEYPQKFLFKIAKVCNFSKKKYNLFIFFSKLYNHFWLLFLFPFFFLQFILSILVCSSKELKNSHIGFVHNKKTLYDFSLLDTLTIKHIRLKVRDLSQYISIKNKIDSILLTFRVAFLLVSKREDLSIIHYNSLKFHFNDLYKLILYINILQQVAAKNEYKIVLNSHYDRWIYIASHLCGNNLSVVQHGRIIESIIFPHEYGSINYLYAYNQESAEIFSKYYKNITQVSFIKAKLNLRDVRNNDVVTLFIASSVSSISAELEFIKRIKAEMDIKIFIKLHPLYDYMHNFTPLGKEIELIDYFPLTDITITYNSALGDEYRSMGHTVFFIEEFANICEMVSFITQKYKTLKNFVK